MKKYEGLIILSQPVDEQTLEDKLDNIRAEVTKQGGTVEHTTRMGRQTFARKLKKKDAGFYVLLTFTLDPAKIATLRERYKLNEDVFRIQITIAPSPARDSAKEVDKGAKEAVPAGLPAIALAAAGGGSANGGKPVPVEAGKPAKI
ncbi:MAG: 30S ribosomal protein S6 [Verrucomicrobia bacterium]|nr:30S ribosomal protein S6 [Verrucomicrobiota bacterium]